MPVIEDGRSVWRTYKDIDTSARGAFPYDEALAPRVDPFQVIGRGAVEAGIGRSGRVGDAESHVFEAEPLAWFAVRWLEERFGRQQKTRAVSLTDGSPDMGDGSLVENENRSSWRCEVRHCARMDPPLVSNICTDPSRAPISTTTG
jgi:hypothetical protein